MYIRYFLLADDESKPVDYPNQVYTSTRLDYVFVLFHIFLTEVPSMGI